MAKLNDLPQELIQLICEHLRAFDVPSVASAARVNRRWNDIATEALYTEVNLGMAPRVKSTYRRELLVFAYTILNNPHLAARVRAIRLGFTEWHLFAGQDDDEAITPPVREHFCPKWIQIINEDDQIGKILTDTFKHGYSVQGWLSRIQRWGKNEAVAMALLLARLPNLRLLALRNSHPQIFALLRELSEHHKPQEGDFFFQNLRHLSIEPSDASQNSLIDPLECAFAIPSLNQLRLEYTGSDDGPHGRLSNVDLEEANIKCLSLESGAQLHEQDLERVLKACRGLEMFRYNTFPVNVTTPFRSKKLQDSLLPHRHTLKVLSLTYTLYRPNTCQKPTYPYSQKDPEANPDEGSHPEYDLGQMPAYVAENLRVWLDCINLSKMHALERLEIALPFIFGQGALLFALYQDERSDSLPAPGEEDYMSTDHRLLNTMPSSIREIVFTRMGCAFAATRLDYALQKMLKHRESKFPNLGVVEFCEVERTYGGVSRGNFFWSINKRAHVGDSLKYAYLQPLEKSIALATSKGIEVRTGEPTGLGIGHDEYTELAPWDRWVRRYGDSQTYIGTA